MKVFDSESLELEKLRLRRLAREHEIHFHSQLSGIEHHLGPIGRFFFPTANENQPEGNKTDWLHKGLNLLIPFAVDRITLGARGLLINRGLTAGLQFLAGKITTEKISSSAGSLLDSLITKVGIKKKA